MKTTPIAKLYSDPNIIGITPIQSSEFNGILTNISSYVFVHQVEDTLPLYLVHATNADHIHHHWQLLLQHLCRIVIPELYVFFHDTSCTPQQRYVIHQNADTILRQFRTWTDYSPVQVQMISQNNLYQGNFVDNYLVGTGQHASTACSLLPLMMLSNVQGNQYLSNIAPLIDVLNDNNTLEQFLNQDGLDLVEQVKDWTDKRLFCFSQPTNEELTSHSQILCEKQHPLIKHVQHGFTSLNIKVGDLLTVTNPDNNKNVYNQDYPNHRNIFIMLSLLSLSLLSILITFHPIFIFITVIVAIVIFVLFKLFFAKTHTLANRKIEDDIDEREESTNTHTVKDQQQDDSNNIFPLNIYNHKHLKQLFSRQTFSILQSLVKVMNETHNQLDYLQQHHPYLANSVHELLMDIAINSITRLNQQAENFIQQGTLDNTAKTIFVNEHEDNIVQLLNNHVTEVTALKESIIAKQMAGFANVGGEPEREFRNAVMELKILLSWFVAQESDEAVSKYGFIQQKIETEMLVTIESFYYKSDTTDVQKDELYQQVQELIDYFKSQSPTSAHEELEFIVTDTSHVLGQSDTQNFIDFNKNYLKELQKHW